MRTADLIGAPVLAHDGTRLGHVSDLRLTDDIDAQGQRVLRVVGLVMARGEFGRLLAYDHRPVDRPRLLGLLARRLIARACWISWDDVALAAPGDGGPGTVHLCPAVTPGALTHAQRDWAD